MANWNLLKQSISEIIKENGRQEITGQVLQNVISTIISNLGYNSSYGGIATKDTNPGYPDGAVFYLATTAGVYSNFGGIVINEGEAVILEWNNGQWSKQDCGFATSESVQKVKDMFHEPMTQEAFDSLKDSELIEGTYYSIFEDE